QQRIASITASSSPPALAAIMAARQALPAAAAVAPSRLTIGSSKAEEGPTGPKTRAIHWEGLSEQNVRGTIWDRGSQPVVEGARRSSIVDVTTLLPGLLDKFAVAPSGATPTAGA